MRKLYCGGAVTWGLLSTPVLTPVLTPVSGQVLTRTNTYFCCVNTVPYSAFTVSTLEHDPWVVVEDPEYRTPTMLGLPTISTHPIPLT